MNSLLKCLHIGNIHTFFCKEQKIANNNILLRSQRLPLTIHQPDLLLVMAM